MRKIVKLTVIASVIAIIFSLTLCFNACKSSDDMLEEQFENIAKDAVYTDLSGNSLKKPSSASGDNGDGIVLTSPQEKEFSSVFIKLAKSNISSVKVEAKIDGDYKQIYKSNKWGQNLFCDFAGKICSSAVRITFYGGNWSLAGISVYDLTSSRKGTLIADVSDINSGKIDTNALAISDSVILTAGASYSGEGKILFTDCTKEGMLSAVNSIKQTNSDIKITAEIKTVYTADLDQVDDPKFIRYNAMHYHRDKLIDNMIKFADEMGISGVAIDMSEGMDESSSLLYLSTMLKTLKEKRPDYTVFILTGYSKDVSVSMKISTLAASLFRNDESVAKYADKIMFYCDKDGFFANVKKISQLCEDSFRDKVCVIASDCLGITQLQDSYSYVNACGMSGAATFNGISKA